MLRELVAATRKGEAAAVPTDAIVAELAGRPGHGAGGAACERTGEPRPRVAGTPGEIDYRVVFEPERGFLPPGAGRLPAPARPRGARHACCRSSAGATPCPRSRRWIPRRATSAGSCACARRSPEDRPARRVHVRRGRRASSRSSPRLPPRSRPWTLRVSRRPGPLPLGRAALGPAAPHRGRRRSAYPRRRWTRSSTWSANW